MHFRFHFDGEKFHKEFSTGFGRRGRRWAAFAERFADEFGDGFGGGAGPRRRRRFGAEALRLVILHLLKDEARHGYELIKAIEEMSTGLYSPSPGMVYPMLSLLADEGLISEVDGSEGRRRYAITEAGRATLETAEAELKDVLERLADLARRRNDDAREPLLTAMHGLKTAARERMARNGADQASERALAERIASILNEAARSIDNL